MIRANMWSYQLDQQANDDDDDEQQQEQQEPSAKINFDLIQFSDQEDDDDDEQRIEEPAANNCNEPMEGVELSSSEANYNYGKSWSSGYSSTTSPPSSSGNIWSTNNNFDLFNNYSPRDEQTNIFNFGIDWKSGNFGPIGGGRRLSSSWSTRTNTPPSTPSTPSTPTTPNSLPLSYSAVSAGSSPRSAKSSSSSIGSVSSPSIGRGRCDSTATNSAESATSLKNNNINQLVSKRIHVSNIPFRYRREHLANIFSNFGEISDSEVIFNERGSKGFGFVSFVDGKAAEKAKKALHNVIIDGRKIEVNFATPKPRRLINCNSFGGNVLSSSSKKLYGNVKN